MVSNLNHKKLINMIDNNMYSLCDDINNKLFTGRLYFASCLVIIKVNLQRFDMNISTRESNYHLHLNHCLQANSLEYLSCSSQNCHYLILTCFSLFRKVVVQTFLENKMMLTSLSLNLMPFFIFPY